MKVPHDRYHNDVMGMPCFAAEESFIINVSRESMVGAVARDDENCAVALGCKAQLNSPYVSVGRHRTDLALPHPQGVQKPGYGSTKWAVIRFKNSKKVRDIIVAADTDSLDDDGAVIELLPTGKSERGAQKKKRNIKNYKGTQKRDRNQAKDELTEMGVRILTGQRRQA
jgi:hypothetical protein